PFALRGILPSCHSTRKRRLATARLWVRSLAQRCSNSSIAGDSGLIVSGNIGGPHRQKFRTKGRARKTIGPCIEGVNGTYSKNSKKVDCHRGVGQLETKTHLRSNSATRGGANS